MGSRERQALVTKNNGGTPTISSRLRYYASSIPSLISGIRNWPVAAASLAGLGPRQPFLIHLRDGSRFYVRGAMDIWVLKETVLDRQYEQGGVQIENGWTVVDIGAGLGDFAVSVARRHPRARILAYEPFPESFRLLERNLVLNGTHNVSAQALAVGITASTIRLHTGSREAVQHSTAVASMDQNGVPVPGTSLAAIFEEHQIAVCDLLKADCEGAEYDILLNAGDELGRIRHVSLEYHDDVTSHSHEEIQRHLSAHGFLVTTSPSPVHAELGLMFGVSRRAARFDPGLGEASSGEDAPS